MDLNSRPDAGQGTRAADAGQALAMLTAFASVGARSFDVTMTDVNGEKTGYQVNRSLEELRRTTGRALQAAATLQQNFIIRPRSTTATLIQLDDLTGAKADRITPHAFMVLETSPGNFQAWVAVEKGASEDFSRRLRKGNGPEPFADLSASGATRIAGSRNFKTKYAPAFPLVAITQTNPGYITDSAMLELAGFVAAREETRPAAKAAPFRISPERRSRKAWPSYQICIQGAPRANGEDKPDISRADFTWCRTAIEWGWSREDTAERLMTLSSKAKENGEAYATATASRAAASVERQPYRAKPEPRP